MTMHIGPVLVVFNQFPKRSETFVFDEFVTWRDHGIGVRAVSLLRPQRQDLPAEMTALVDQVICLKALTPGKVARLLAGRSSARPMKALRRLVRAIRSAGTRHDLLCSVAGWAAGVALASVVDDTAARHLHAAWANTPAEACLHASAIAAVPYTVSVHAADYWRDTPATAPRLTAAKRIVACNSGVFDDLRQRNPALEPRLHLLPHSARTDRFAPVERAPGPPWKILAVGRHVAKKGLPILIDACQRLAQAEVDFTCTIAGDGTRHRSLARQVRAHRLDDRVILAGPLDHDQVARLMAHSHLLAAPSIVAPDQDRDGVPNVIVEALLTVMPVVASRCGSIPDVIEPGSTGLLVEPADPEALAGGIVNAIEDWDGALAMARTGHDRILDRLGQETQGPFLERVFTSVHGRP